MAAPKHAADNANTSKSIIIIHHGMYYHNGRIGWRWKEEGKEAEKES